MIENYELIKNTNEFKAKLEQIKQSYGIYNKSNNNVNLENIVIKVEKLKSIGVCNDSNGSIIFGKKDEKMILASPIIYAIKDNTLAISNNNGKIEFYDGTFSTLISVKNVITDVLNNYKINENIGENVINTTLVIIEETDK